MTRRPCLGCGEPTAGTRCPTCAAERQRQHDARRDRKHPHWNPTRWQKLSRRVRKLQPFCVDCGATADLCADHIIPVAERPDLAYRVENVAVRCRSCNGRKANRPPNDQERTEVEQRLAHRRGRRTA